MKCTEELLQQIKEAIEATTYGSVTVSLSEKGAYWEITTEKKARIQKPPENTYHRG